MFGPTGAGKTWLVNDQANQAPAETYHKNSGKFWYDYQGETQVIYDDFDGSFELQDFLKWTDRYPIKVKVYHSERELCSTISYVTSNQPPWEFYPRAPQVARAGIYRRFRIFEAKWKVIAGQGYASIMEKDGMGHDMWMAWKDMHPWADDHETM